MTQPTADQLTPGTLVRVTARLALMQYHHADLSGPGVVAEVSPAPRFEDGSVKLKLRYPHLSLEDIDGGYVEVYNHEVEVLPALANLYHHPKLAALVRLIRQAHREREAFRRQQEAAEAVAAVKREMAERVREIMHGKTGGGEQEELDREAREKERKSIQRAHRIARSLRNR